MANVIPDGEKLKATQRMQDYTESHHRPETYGYAWADDDAPRFQLAPMGYRGYIEGRPVRPLSPA